MPEGITPDTTEIIKDVSSKAANPIYVLGIGFLLLLCFFLFAAYYLVSSFGKPMMDANVQSVQASTEAIKSNADTQRQMSKTMEGIRTTQDDQRRLLEKIQEKQDGIYGKCEQGLRDHTVMQNTLERKPGT
jgi:Na+-transporting methylmalonyl-CoA/oxaloacetate decarboxylase gamma subunit